MAFVHIQENGIFYTGEFPNKVIALGKIGFTYVYHVPLVGMKYKQMSYFYWEKMAYIKDGKPHVSIYRGGRCVIP